MKFTTEKQIREAVRNQLSRLMKEASVILSEETEETKLSNADMAKGLKMGAADLAATVPTKLNSRFVEVMKALKAMAAVDRTSFEKVADYAIKYSQNAQKKMDKK